MDAKVTVGALGGGGQLIKSDRSLWADRAQLVFVNESAAQHKLRHGEDVLQSGAGRR